MQSRTVRRGDNRVFKVTSGYFIITNRGMLDIEIKTMIFVPPESPEPIIIHTSSIVAASTEAGGRVIVSFDPEAWRLKGWGCSASG